MAYINLAGGLKINSADSVDSRLVLSLNEMLTMHYDSTRPAALAGKIFQLPDHYLCICSDDGKIYLYDSSNEPDLVTGKFRELQTGSAGPQLKEIDISDPTLEEIVDLCEGCLEGRYIGFMNTEDGSYEVYYYNRDFNNGGSIDKLDCSFVCVHSLDDNDDVYIKVLDMYGNKNAGAIEDWSIDYWEQKVAIQGASVKFNSIALNGELNFDNHNISMSNGNVVIDAVDYKEAVHTNVQEMWASIKITGNTYGRGLLNFYAKPANNINLSRNQVLNSLETFGHLEDFDKLYMLGLGDSGLTFDTGGQNGHWNIFNITKDMLVVKNRSEDEIFKVDISNKTVTIDSPSGVIKLGDVDLIGAEVLYTEAPIAVGRLFLIDGDYNARLDAYWSEDSHEVIVTVPLVEPNWGTSLKVVDENGYLVLGYGGDLGIGNVSVLIGDNRTQAVQIANELVLSMEDPNAGGEYYGYMSLRGNYMNSIEFYKSVDTDVLKLTRFHNNSKDSYLLGTGDLDGTYDVLRHTDSTKRLELTGGNGGSIWLHSIPTIWGSQNTNTSLEDTQVNINLLPDIEDYITFSAGQGTSTLGKLKQLFNRALVVGARIGTSLYRITWADVNDESSLRYVLTSFELNNGGIYQFSSIMVNCSKNSGGTWNITITQEDF